MLKKQRLFCLVGILLIVVPYVLFAQEGLRKEGRYYIADIKKEFKVQSNGNLVMSDINGDVTVTTWNEKIVQIHEIRKMDVYTKAEAEAIYKDAQSIYRQDGNTVHVGGEGYYRSYMHGKFFVKVPTNFNINVQTSGGDISVTDLAGRVDLKTSGGDLTLTKIDGVVNAKTSGGDIEIKQNKQAVTAKTSGGDIDVIDVEGTVDAKTSGGSILVRNNKAKVYAKTSGGSIRLDNVGAEVDASTSGGDIEVNTTAGPIDVSTSGGNIDLKNVHGKAHARTSGGDIDAVNVVDGIDVHTSGGDLDLRDIKGSIDAKTSGGDVDAVMTLSDFSKDHHVELKSSGGDLTLTIPAKLPATIRAEIKLGNSWNRGNYDIYSDFDLKKEVTSNGQEYIRMQGKINGGGDLINLTTSNGNITIKKN